MSAPSGSNFPVQFVTRSRPSFADIDPYGHVNTQHYVRYFIEHRFHGMREVLGWDLHKLGQFEIHFVVTDLHVRFIAPLIGDTEFQITSWIEDFAEKTGTVKMKLERGSDQKLLSECTMHIAGIDARTKRPIQWPEWVLSSFRG